MVTKNTLKSPLILIFACVCISMSSKLHAEAPTGEIKGTVKTSDNNPAAGVNIYLKEAEKSTISEANGNFTFRKVKEGTYTLTITFVGKQSQQKVVNVVAGQVTTEDFILQETKGQLAEVVITARKSANKKPVSIGKFDIAPLDLPQSVSIISDAVIEQQQSQRLSDVVKNANGIYLGTTRGSTQETFYARGYSFGSNNMFKNGSRVNTGSMPEVSSLERVEILKGSAAILYGNVAPGGILNMVTKKPKFEQGAEISMRTGSYDLYKPSMDLYGPINSNIAYRFNGSYENANSFRSQVSSQRYYFNPSFLFKVGKKTDFIVQGDYLNDDFTPDFGTGAINNKIATLSRSTFLGTPWANGNTRQATASANITHQFNTAWNLDFNGSYQSYKREFQTVERVQPAANGDWTRPLGKSNASENYYTGQINLTGKFKTGFLSHTLLTGVDADRYLNTNYTYTETRKDPVTKEAKFEYLDQNNVRQSANYDIINILDPVKYAARADIPFMNPLRVTETPTQRYGIYANDLITISPKFNVLVGLRWSYQKALATKTTNLLSHDITKGLTKNDKAFSPRVGIVYKPISSSAIFASYSNSFTVNTGTDVYGNGLKPSLVDQYEIGLKNDLLKGLLSANITAYRILNHNLAQTAPYMVDGITPNTNSALKELTGQTTSDGIEVDITGHPTAGLDLVAGYSYNFMRYTKTPDAPGNYIEGERLVNSPAHTANASAFYTLSTTNLEGLRLGATVNYIGKRLGGWNNTIGQAQTESRLIPVSDFATADLSAGYSFRKLSLLIKVSNLTNTLNYYVHENYSINPIPPRQFITTVSYKF